MTHNNKMDSNFVNKLVGPKDVSKFEHDITQLLMDKAHDPILSGERTKMTLAQQLDMKITQWVTVRNDYGYEEYTQMKVRCYYEVLNSTDDKKEIDEFLDDYWVQWMMEGLLP